MSTITPKNGRADFITAWNPHTYWELNSTNLGTNYGRDTTGLADNTNIVAGSIGTSDSYDGMLGQYDPPGSGWLDIYCVTDAAALLYIPSGLTVGNSYGIFSNGGGTNVQGGVLLVTSTGVQVCIIHVNGGTNADNMQFEIPNADLDAWHSVGFQFSQEGGDQGDMGLWIDGVKECNGTRAFQIIYGSGNVDFGAYGGDSPTVAGAVSPYGVTSTWPADAAITGTGILIANFTGDVTGDPPTSTTVIGNGDAWYEDYFTYHTVAAVVDPEITNIDDEDFYEGETGITISGTTFEVETGNSRVRIDSSSAGTGTSQTQTDTSWSATSIDFTVSLGSLNYGTNYVFVRNDTLLENTTGYPINLYQNILTTGLNDTTFYDGQTGIEINGSGFGSSQGTSKLYLSSASNGSGTNVAQTITSWTDTKITFTVAIGALSLGTIYAIVGRDNSSLGDSSERLSPSQTATLNEAPVTPSITNIEDEQLTDAEIEVLIDGTGFGSSQGTGKVELCASSVYGTSVSQFVNNWADSQVEITVVKGTLDIGANYMFITNDDGNRNTIGYYITLNAAASSDGLYQSASFQITITSSGMSTTAFLIKDE